MRAERRYRIAPEDRAAKSPPRRQRGHGTYGAPGRARSHSAPQSPSATTASLPVPPRPGRHSLRQEEAYSQRPCESAGLSETETESNRQAQESTTILEPHTMQ